MKTLAVMLAALAAFYVEPAQAGGVSPVYVDTNSLVVVYPTNLFAKNGMAPSGQVASVQAQVTSNDADIVALLASNIYAQSRALSLELSNAVFNAKDAALFASNVAATLRLATIEGLTASTDTWWGVTGKVGMVDWQATNTFLQGRMDATAGVVNARLDSAENFTNAAQLGYEHSLTAHAYLSLGNTSQWDQAYRDGTNAMDRIYQIESQTSGINSALFYGTNLNDRVGVLEGQTNQANTAYLYATNNRERITTVSNRVSVLEAGLTHTAWSMEYFGADGLGVDLGNGAANQYLQSQGASQPPRWYALVASATNVLLANMESTNADYYVPMSANGAGQRYYSPAQARTNLGLNVARLVETNIYGTVNAGTLGGFLPGSFIQSLSPGWSQGISNNVAITSGVLEVWFNTNYPGWSDLVSTNGFLTHTNDWSIHLTAGNSQKLAEAASGTFLTNTAVLLADYQTNTNQDWVFQNDRYGSVLRVYGEDPDYTGFYVPDGLYENRMSYRRAGAADRFVFFQYDTQGWAMYTGKNNGPAAYITYWNDNVYAPYVNQYGIGCTMYVSNATSFVVGVLDADGRYSIPVTETVGGAPAVSVLKAQGGLPRWASSSGSTQDVLLANAGLNFNNVTNPPAALNPWMDGTNTHFYTANGSNAVAVDLAGIDLSGYATGTPVYAESDPVWQAATGTGFRVRGVSVALETVDGISGLQDVSGPTDAAVRANIDMLSGVLEYFPLSQDHKTLDWINRAIHTNWVFRGIPRVAQSVDAYAYADGHDVLTNVTVNGVGGAVVNGTVDLAVTTGISGPAASNSFATLTALSAGLTDASNKADAVRSGCSNDFLKVADWTATTLTNSLAWTYCLPETNWGPMLSKTSTIVRLTGQTFSGATTGTVLRKFWTNGWETGTAVCDFPMFPTSGQAAVSYGIPALYQIGVVFPAASTQACAFTVEVAQ